MTQTATSGAMRKGIQEQLHIDHSQCHSNPRMFSFPKGRSPLSQTKQLPMHLRQSMRRQCYSNKHRLSMRVQSSPKSQKREWGEIGHSYTLSS